MRLERRIQILLVVSAVLMGSMQWACESAPLRSIRAARDYSAGTEALDAGRPQQAVVLLQRAARTMPEASEIQNHLGLAYLAGGEPEAARRAFERALVLDCDNGAARHNLDAMASSGPGPASASGPKSESEVEGAAAHGG